MFKKTLVLLSLFTVISCNDTSGGYEIDCPYSFAVKEGETATYVITKTKLFNGTYSLSKISNNEINVLFFKPDGASKNYAFTKGDCSYFSSGGESNFMALSLANQLGFFYIGAADYLNAIDQEGNVLKELSSINVKTLSCDSSVNIEPWSVDKEICTGDFELQELTFNYTQEFAATESAAMPPGRGIQLFKMEVNDESVLEIELTEWNCL